MMPGRMQFNPIFYRRPGQRGCRGLVWAATRHADAKTAAEAVSVSASSPRSKPRYSQTEPALIECLRLSVGLCVRAVRSCRRTGPEAEARGGT